MKQDGHYALGFSGKYELPVCDVQSERRNFPGYVEYEPMLPLTDTSGTTETDSATAPKSGGYTKINSKG
jgi:hypothetical protein